MMRSLCLAVLGAGLLAGPARSMSEEDFVAATLLPGWRMEDGSHMAAIRVEMAEGWHTYWRQPGDAGIPPSFDWSGSRNLIHAEVIWPLPVLFEQGGVLTVGYKETVVFPLRVQTQTDQAATISGTMFLGVCKDVCIPVEIRLFAELPATGSPDKEISASLSRQPIRASGTAPTCRAHPIADGLSLTVTLDREAPPEHLVVETGDPTIWASDPEIAFVSGKLSATTDLVPAEAKPFLLARADVTVTLFQDGEVIEYRGCTGP